MAGSEDFENSENEVGRYLRDHMELTARKEDKEPEQTDSKMPDKLPSPVIEGVSSAQSVGKNDDCVIPKISLSATDEIDHDQVSTITPSKRTRASLLPGNQNDEVQDLIGSKFSATKMSKQPNITKHPKME